MYLKSLAIKGFKSFADPATLELEPGVTVVVGPNGSGKSNVVDALAWVLGAQAPKAVRSQKMDDVIFAGTAKRPALGRAEVSITIDNSDGTLPIEFSEVQVTRTLFRTGESEYAINGVSCRLLDVQDLLSDSGVGRQQHIIVSQGQIDAVLNARPEDRRQIIEEAAGVLKYRKRKERSERRLASTDDNLARLSDLVREVKRQLKPLEKQANAARRHGDLITELTALKLHLTGRELRSITTALESAKRQHHEFDARERDLAVSLARLDAIVIDAEAELNALGGSDVTDILSRARSLRERIRGQVNVVAERHRRLSGELQSTVDEGVVSSLEAESARIAADLAATLADKEALAPEFESLEQRAAAMAADLAAFEEEWGEGVGPAPVAAAEVRAQLTALRSAAERDRQESNRILEQLETISERRDRLERDGAAAAADAARLEADELPALESAFALAQNDRDRAEVQLEAATEERRAADADVNRWQARADALEQALASARSAAGADALAQASGVLGILLDLVDIDDGWDAAVEAAAGEALQAVVVDDVDNGRAALAALASSDLTGAVLALSSRRTAPTVRDVGVPPVREVGAPTVPGVGASVRSHVRATRSDVEPLLDALFADAIAVEGDWRAAVDTALEHPELTVVTRSGDRFASSGWRIGQAGTGATGAALDEARHEAETAARRAADATAQVNDARAELEEAKRQRRQLEEQLRVAKREFENATAAAERAKVEMERVSADRLRLQNQQAEIAARQDRDRSELDDLQLQLPGLEADEAAHLDRTQQMGRLRASLEDRNRALSSVRTNLEVKAAGITEREEILRRRTSEVEQRLERLVVEREQARVRREKLEVQLGVVQGLARELDEHGRRLADWLVALEAEQQEQSVAVKDVSRHLSAKRGERKQAERELVEVRERRSKVELGETEARVRLETLTEAMRRELDVEPEVAMAAPLPDVPANATPESRVRDLERELKLLGPINPLALEEFAEIQERHEFLTGQLDDIKSSRRELQRLIREIDERIVTVFSEAYADVATNFTELFDTLFPGGKGTVQLTNPEDLLNCGVEIEAKPGGKNVKKLSLLSGGERSLTALGFLFAVFRSRPSPFYVMDEVEAALDDMNISRFLSLIEEFRKDAQLIIVSHQKRTMEAADVLYGVSMKPGGSSKVVSEKVEKKRAEIDLTADGTAAATDDVDLRSDAGTTKH
ncbi:MAG: chromosome segregation protein SMC [Acidimicrobiales bacterium]